MSGLFSKHCNTDFSFAYAVLSISIYCVTIYCTCYPIVIVVNKSYHYYKHLLILNLIQLMLLQNCWFLKQWCGEEYRLLIVEN